MYPERLVKEYRTAVGLQQLSEPTHLTKTPTDTLITVADFFDGATHEPLHPTVQRSYQSFCRETELQFRFLIYRGLKVDPQTEEYESWFHMIDDVDVFDHLFYFPTSEGFGPTNKQPKNHPMLKTDPVSGMCYNDIFRIVHDIFGHCPTQEDFSPLGEVNAYLNHRSLYSPLSRRALASETLCQTAWVEFGKHTGRKNPDGNFNGTYAEQKCVNVPYNLIYSV